MSALTRLKSGAYGELEPWSSSSGAIRLPANAPPAKPASERALTTSPCAWPQSAISATNAMMIQSIAVTLATHVPAGSGRASAS
jgi:hypothetical protein